MVKNGNVPCNTRNYQKIFLNNKKIKVYSPNHKRAFCYIDDAVEQIIKITNSSKNREFIILVIQN